jgi:hypothetical protein
MGKDLLENCITVLWYTKKMKLYSDFWPSGRIGVGSRSSYARDGTIVPLDNGAGISDLVELDQGSGGIDLVGHCLVGATFFHRDVFRERDLFTLYSSTFMGHQRVSKKCP